MSYSSEQVKKWRANFKSRMVEAMGGKCAACGYDRCQEAMEFHHLDPSEKDLSLSQARANPIAWKTIVVELRKCVMLCANCHREVHAGVRILLGDLPKFDENFVDYRAMNVLQEKDDCPVCGEHKPVHQKTCSMSCAAKIRHKIDWAKYDLIELSRTMNNVQIAEMIGCSDGLIWKKLKKLRNQA